MLRQHQRTITKAQRELDRERERLERQEKKLIADIKKSAKANQMVRDKRIWSCKRTLCKVLTLEYYRVLAK